MRDRPLPTATPSGSLRSSSTRSAWPSIMWWSGRSTLSLRLPPASSVIPRRTGRSGKKRDRLIKKIESGRLGRIDDEILQVAQEEIRLPPLGTIGEIPRRGKVGRPEAEAAIPPPKEVGDAASGIFHRLNCRREGGKICLIGPADDVVEFSFGRFVVEAELNDLPRRADLPVAHHVRGAAVRVFLDLIDDHGRSRRALFKETRSPAPVSGLTWGSRTLPLLKSRSAFLYRSSTPISFQ